MTESEALAQRRKLAGDRHRPLYHFLAPANWMNDPNGVIEWHGRFHLFYQYNPFAAVFGLKHWGHAVSEDLVHWTDLPIALTPTPGGPDETGCWSGCMLDDDGTATIVYTGVRGDTYSVQTQCLATSRDDLLTWEKLAGNPVLSEIPAVAGPTHDFRDPFVWREGDVWFMLLASRIAGEGGVVFLYRSPDLQTWEYLHPLLTGKAAETGDVWECPNFFSLGDKWVLLVSGKDRNVPFTIFWFLGDYTDHTFTPEVSGTFDHGYLYAPLTMQDDQGRRLLFGWLREGRSTDAHKAAGWAGAHMIPRVVGLEGGVITMAPVPELERLRGEGIELTGVQLTGEESVLDTKGRALDIVAVFEPAGPVGLALACAPDGGEQTRISYDPEARELVVDRSRSSVSADVETFPHRAAHILRPGELLELRILLDGSVLEIIANGRTSISTRIYPERADCQWVRLFGQGLLRQMSVWPMRPIWPAGES